MYSSPLSRRPVTSAGSIGRAWPSDGLVYVTEAMTQDTPRQERSDMGFSTSRELRVRQVYPPPAPQASRVAAACSVRVHRFREHADHGRLGAGLRFRKRPELEVLRVPAALAEDVEGPVPVILVEHRDHVAVPVAGARGAAVGAELAAEDAVG